jgi:hypothetical protein
MRQRLESAPDDGVFQDEITLFGMPIRTDSTIPKGQFKLEGQDAIVTVDTEFINNGT